MKDHCLDLPNNTQLVDELCSVKLRETVPGVVRLDHSASGFDDQAVTIAMAAQYLLANAATGEAGSATAEMAPVPRRQPAGVTMVAASPWTRNAWAASRTTRRPR